MNRMLITGAILLTFVAVPADDASATDPCDYWVNWEGAGEWWWGPAGESQDVGTLAFSAHVTCNEWGAQYPDEWMFRFDGLHSYAHCDGTEAGSTGKVDDMLTGVREDPCADSWVADTVITCRESYDDVVVGANTENTQYDWGNGFATSGECLIGDLPQIY